MEALNRKADIDRMHTRLLNLGLLLNVLAPAVLIFVGAFLKARGVGGNGISDLRVFFWVLIVVALSEIVVIYIIKRSFLSGSKAFQRSHRYVTAEQTLVQCAVIIFSLALAPTIYGLVYYLFGGTLERFILFAAITLFCFLVFKPKLEEISSFVKRQAGAEKNVREF